MLINHHFDDLYKGNGWGKGHPQRTFRFIYNWFRLQREDGRMLPSFFIFSGEGVITPTIGNIDYLNQFTEDHFPIVLVNRYDPKVEHIPRVTGDNYQTGYLATKAFLRVLTGREFSCSSYNGEKLICLKLICKENQPMCIVKWEVKKENEI